MLCHLVTNVMRSIHTLDYVVIVGAEGSVDVLEMALRMASEPQDSGTC